MLKDIFFLLLLQGDNVIASVPMFVCLSDNEDEQDYAKSSEVIFIKSCRIIG